MIHDTFMIRHFTASTNHNHHLLVLWLSTYISYNSNIDGTFPVIEEREHCVDLLRGFTWMAFHGVWTRGWWMTVCSPNESVCMCVCLIFPINTFTANTFNSVGVFRLYFPQYFGWPNILRVCSWPLSTIIIYRPQMQHLDALNSYYKNVSFSHVVLGQSEIRPGKLIWAIFFRRIFLIKDDYLWSQMRMRLIFAHCISAPMESMNEMNPTEEIKIENGWPQ